jgi:cytochrome c
MKKFLAIALTLSFAPAAFAEEAAEVWKAKCKSCHGEDGRAKTKVGAKEKMTDITTAEWHAKHSDEKIRKVIADGSENNNKMKAFKDKLSAQEIDALVAYIRTLKK